MSIMLAVMGCVAASGSTKYELALPPSRTLTSVGYSEQEVVINYRGSSTGMLEFKDQDGTEVIDWNPNDYDPSLFQKRLRLTSGTPPSNSSFGPSWTGMHLSSYATWSQNSVGDANATGVFEVRVASTEEVIASTSLSVDVERMS